MALPISFLSDFGLDDEFVGVVHAVLARISPESRIIDVTHHVSPGNVKGGALALVRAIQYLPQGVALAVVDPGVGTERRPIAAATPWGYLVGPDNGLLAPAVQMVGGAEQIVVLESEEHRLPRDGVTFDGRDVFAPAAALLAAGEVELAELGSPLPMESATPLMLPLPEAGDGAISGEVLWVDRFGNCQVNVAPDDLGAVGIEPGSTVEVVVGSQTYRVDWVTSYGGVADGEALVHVDSYGQMAVAVRGGRAADDLNLAEGTAVTLRTLR